MKNQIEQIIKKLQKYKIHKNQAIGEIIQELIKFKEQLK